MKGIVPLFLGIFGTFAFSWAGLILIPNYQIGYLDPQMDEDGSDVYPAPKSGMAERGRRIYAANGCVYCHSQQVRADYAASDIDRKWGERRSAPRDYLFERPVLLGKMRMGPDLANVGKRAPAEDQNAPPPSSTNATSSVAPQTSPVAQPAPGTSPSSLAAPPATSPAASATPSPAAAAAPSVSPAASPAKVVAATTSPSPARAASAPPAASPTASAAPSPAAGAPSVSPAASPAKVVAATTSPSPAPAISPATAASPANPAMTAATSADTTVAPDGAPLPYTAAWHHRHLYNPRSITLDSNMPAYHFLYEKRPISGQRAADALQLSETDAVPEGWEVVPTYDAKCLVAYLMSLDQSHPLKEVKATSAPPASAPVSSPAAASTSPAPAPTKEAK